MFEPWLKSSYDRFKDALNQGRMPSSIILSGAPALGSAGLALACAKLYLCKDRIEGEPCHTCKSCLLFEDLLNGSHPDINILTSSTTDMAEDGLDLTHSYANLYSDMGTPLEGFVDSKNVGARSVRVSGVRALSEWIYQGSVFGNGKVAIISNAHMMNESSSNALLKTFEEPPKDTLIILLTKSFESLPATILSRAFKIQIPKVDDDIALSFLRDKLGASFDKQRALCALALSNNSPLGAITIFRREIDKVANEIISRINESISSNLGPEQAVLLLLTLSNEEKALILQEFILELLKYKARVGIEQLPLLQSHNLDLLCRIPASHLFEAYNDLRFVKADDYLIPNRAPTALISAWIKALKNIGR